MIDTGPNFGPIIWRNTDDIQEAQEAQAARQEATRIIGQLDAGIQHNFDVALQQHIRQTT